MAHGRLVVRFGPCEFDHETGDLSRPDAGARLRPQAAKVLAILIDRAPHVVSKEEIRRAVWGDAVHVDFDQAIDNALWQIRDALGEDPHAPQYIETLPRRGYRFLPSVTTAVVSRALEPGEAAAPPHAIAVLPFESMSPEPRCAYFADAMTDELVTNLARTCGYRVPSRTSVIRYKPTLWSLRMIAEHLHVDHVVEGSVLCDGDNVRVNVQLLDARADVHVWSASYERDLRDELALQRELSARIVESVCEALGAGQGDAPTPRAR